MPDKKHIFISYSTRNKSFVDNLRQDLQNARLNVWIDQEGLITGTPNWERALREAIREAYALVLVASPDAYESRYVQGEIEVAKMYSCPIFPVWVVGENWGDCVPLDMIKMQYADMRAANYSIGLRQVVEQLKKSDPAFSITATQFRSTSSVPTDFLPRNPYKGLRAFTQKDQGDFFGRDELVYQLVDILKETNFLSVLGPSGSGKSSLVMAGLLPKLQLGALPNSEHWVYLDRVLPGSNPIEALAIVLSDAMGTSISSILEDLEYGPRGLQLLLRKLSKKRDAMVVIFIDQFEEVFTQTPDSRIRTSFIDLLTQAVVASSEKICKVITTLRADFYDRPMEYPQFAILMEMYSKSVLPMTVDEIRKVIEAPAQSNDVRIVFESELIGDLLYEVRGENNALPLLQFTLDQLFRGRDGLTITRQLYNEIGGIKGALAAHAESVYMSLLTNEQKKMARHLFLRLIEPNEIEQETTRRRAKRQELVLTDETETTVLQAVLEVFVNARLLTVSENTVELGHETIIREWRRLSEWVKTAQEDLAIQDFISRDVEEWIKYGRLDNDLYRGDKAVRASEWAERNLPSADEKYFIDASIKQMRQVEDEEKKRKDLVRDLHDGLSQTISAISMHLTLIPRLYKRGSVLEAEEELEKTHQLALRAVKEVRIAMSTLRPMALESQGLGAALQQLAEKLEHVYSQRLDLSIDPEVLRHLDIQKQEILFYLFEEGTSIARKYAQASLIKLSLRSDGDRVIAEISDNGRGFDSSLDYNRTERSSFGMVNMRERAELIGGDLSIQSDPSLGTTIIISIPLAQHSSAG